MDTMPVVLRHASWSRDRGGLGWRYFVVHDKGGAWWNRFPWAKQKLKQVCCRINASICRDCPDSGNNTEVAPGSAVMFEGKAELEIAKTNSCVRDSCDKKGLN